jgi:AmmeMemoRadiSam system protein B/AmmeMemoRadiSam system protein A
MRTKTSALFFLLLLLPAMMCSNAVKNNNRHTLNTSQIMDRDTLIDRQPAVAGTFYPSDTEALNQLLTDLFSNAESTKQLKHIAAVIAPHAGYVYSGIVAASAYKQLPAGHHYDNVFIIGSSHYVNFDGASIYSKGNFITPLGKVRVNIPLCKKLLEENKGLFAERNDAQMKEHSIEVQIPFLQKIFAENLQIVPVIIATQQIQTIEKIATALSPYFGKNNLFVISTDFSHYPSYADAVNVDHLTAKAIMTNSPDQFMDAMADNENKHISNLATSICGWSSVLMLLNITSRLNGVEMQDIIYKNSGDVRFGDKNRVVGYHAMAITVDNSDGQKAETENFSLTNEEKEKLLRIARVTIQTFLEKGEIRDVETSGLSPRLLKPMGAFVTLTKQQALRGCIGQFYSEQPLYKVVQDMAIAAAFRDYRFPKVTRDELDLLEIEISVLTPMKKIESIDEIEPGIHGIYIKKGSKSGTFLPQVATQTGWNIEEFLGHCARDKAGIGWDGWKDADIYTYEAYVFKEHE